MLSRRTIHLQTFTDERKNINDWNYSCTLFVPSAKFSAVKEDLIDKRNRNNYHHELKYSAIKKETEKAALAEAWFEALLKDPDERFYFMILGLNTKQLDANRFGEGKLAKGSNYANLYNRFYRTVLSKLGFFFSQYDEIVVDKVFHDREGRLEKHEYFDWHAIKKTENTKIRFAEDKVCFVNSDHQKESEFPDASHLIQLCDILAGCVSDCMEQETCRHAGRAVLARQMLPLIQRMIEKPDNKNSKYHYYRKYDISFFPKPGGERSELYKDRRIKLRDFLSGQQSLNFE